MSAIKAYLLTLWYSLVSVKDTGKDVIEAARLLFLANLYSQNIKRLLNNGIADLNKSLSAGSSKP